MAEKRARKGGVTKILREKGLFLDGPNVMPLSGWRKKHSKGKALSILAARLGRAAYAVLKRREPFDPAKFLAHS